MSDDRRRDQAAGVLETLRDMPRFTRYVLLGVLINQFGSFLLTFLVLYLLDRGYSAADGGLALGVYTGGAIAGTLVGGWFTDRLGARLTIIGAVGATSLLTLSVTMLPNLPSILVAVFLAGGMILLSRPAVTALLLQSVPKERQVMVQAMYRTALNTGAAAGPFMAAWLSLIDWNLVFYFGAATAMSYCVLAWFVLPRDQRPATIPAKSGDAGPGEPAAATSSYLIMLRDTRYLGYLAVQLANGLVHIQFFAVLPVMLNEAGYPTIAYSVAIGISASLVITTELLITKQTQRWPLWVAVLAGWLLLVVGRGGYGLFEFGGLAVLFTATLLGGLGQVIGGPSAFAYPARVAPPGATGRYLGAAFSTFQIGYTIGPPVGVALWLLLGAPFWAVVGGFGLLVSLLLVWSMRPPRTPAGGAEPAAEPVPVPMPQNVALEGVDEHD